MSRATALIAAGTMGAIGIGLGAFGAHGLAATHPETDLAVWRTAAHYHQLHALALLALALAHRDEPSANRRWLSWAATAFICGVTLFSGSLYLLVLTQTRWLGAITPLGGLLLICGWVLIIGQGMAARTAISADGDRKGSP